MKLFSLFLPNTGAILALIPTSECYVCSLLGSITNCI